MKTILKIEHMQLLLPANANVTQLLKVLSQSKRLDWDPMNDRDEKWVIKPIRELKVEIVEDKMIREEKKKA